MTQHSLLIGMIGLPEATPCRLSSGVIDPSPGFLRRIFRPSLMRPSSDPAPRLVALAPGVLALCRREQPQPLDARDDLRARLAALDRVDPVGHARLRGAEAGGLLGLRLLGPFGREL